MKRRTAKLKRVTKETQITLGLNLDGAGKSLIKTGIPFFDHMLTLLAKHAVVDLNLKCQGDLEVDAHHTVEDCGLALGAILISCLWQSYVRQLVFSQVSQDLVDSSLHFSRPIDREGPRPNFMRHYGATCSLPRMPSRRSLTR